jgi:hypothetical protein
LQADIAFLHKIQEREASVQIAARNRDDEPQIAFDQALASALPIDDLVFEAGLIAFGNKV